MDSLEEILIHAAEADVGEKGQKDGMGKLERKARNYLILACISVDPEACAHLIQN